MKWYFALKSAVVTTEPHRPSQSLGVVLCSQKCSSYNALVEKAEENAWYFALKSAVVTTLLFQAVFCSLLRLLDFRLQIFGETEATFCLTPEGSTRSPLVLLRGFGFAGVLSISTARFFILMAAFSSRSITSPQCGHLWVRTLNVFGTISPHPLQA